MSFKLLDSNINLLLVKYSTAGSGFLPCKRKIDAAKHSSVVNKQQIRTARGELLQFFGEAAGAE